MNTRQLRDIAAYWGAPYSAMYNTGRGLESRSATVESEELQDLRTGGILSNFKLHLRQISSLTDEEIREIGQLNNPFGSPKDRSPGRVYRNKMGFLIRYKLHTFYLTTYGLMLAWWENKAGEKTVNYLDGLHYARTIGYLQSIGVYVPGTIDAELVEVTQSNP